MVLRIREHIEIRGNNPLDVIVAGTHHKAYLVANLALQDSPQAAAAHYGIELADVYSAMAFYYDNETMIAEAIRMSREQAAQLGARSARSALEEIKARKPNDEKE